MASPELLQFMAAKYRVAELEGLSPGFEQWSHAKLHKEMRVRQTLPIGTRRRRSDFVRALRLQLSEMQLEYRELGREQRRAIFRQTKEAIYARPRLMFASKIKETPGQLGFLDLPAEIRNMIYELALFESPQGEYAELGKWELSLADTRLHPVRSLDYNRGLSLEDLRQDRTISVMSMLAAMNKQIRWEVRTFFWSQIKIILDPLDGGEYYSNLSQFFENIGLDCHRAIRHLEVPPGGCSFDAGRQTLNPFFLVTCQQCMSLKHLKICLPIDVLFRNRDRRALEAYFLRGEELDSPSLNEVVNLFQSLPQLESLRLQMSVDNPSRNYLNRARRGDFFHYAFTGCREARLISEVAKRLKKLPKVKVEVTGGLDQVESYSDWTAWRSSRGYV